MHLVGLSDVFEVADTQQGSQGHHNATRLQNCLIAETETVNPATNKCAHKRNFNRLSRANPAAIAVATAAHRGIAAANEIALRLASMST